MTHDQIREMVRRANPVIDPGSLEHVAASDLEIDRRIEMQTEDRTVADSGRSRWRGPLVGIAAAVAILIGGGVIYLLTMDEGSPVAAPAPNAAELPSDDQLVAPGAYFVDTDGDDDTTTRGTFVLEGSGWGSLVAGVIKDTAESVNNGLYVSLLVVEVAGVWETPCEGGASALPGTTAKALGDQFAAMPGFTTREALAPVTAFGRNGYHLVLEVPAACNDGESLVWTGGLWGERYYQAEGQIVEYWFLDVEGTTVMVEATRPVDSGEEIVTEQNAELDTLLDTLVITP